MGAKRTREFPARLKGVRRRFERWRRTRKVRSRIPESLWASAVNMAGTYGTHRTAKALRVDYYSLKKRVDQEVGAARGVSGRGRVAPVVALAAGGSKGWGGVAEADAAAEFLELVPPVRAVGCECTIEFEDASGATMRIHFRGVEPPDLAALSRSFWRVES